MSEFVIGGKDITSSLLFIKHGYCGLPSRRYKYLWIPLYVFRFFSFRKLFASTCSFEKSSNPVIGRGLFRGFILRRVGGAVVYTRLPAGWKLIITHLLKKVHFSVILEKVSTKNKSPS